MKTCARERCPPTAVLKAMLAKGSVKFGLGMQLGRMEGAKEARAWPPTAHRTAPLSSATPLAQPHTHPSCSARRQGGSLPSPRARLVSLSRANTLSRLLPARQSLGSLAM